MKKVLIVLALAALAMTVFASTASAGKILSKNKAVAVTAQVAKKDCDRDPGCFDHFVANCRRQTLRKWTCIAVNDSVDSSGAPIQCQRRVAIVLKRRTQEIFYGTSNRTCFFV